MIVGENGLLLLARFGGNKPSNDCFQDACQCGFLLNLNICALEREGGKSDGEITCTGEDE